MGLRRQRRLEDVQRPILLSSNRGGFTGGAAAASRDECPFATMPIKTHRCSLKWCRRSKLERFSGVAVAKPARSRSVMAAAVQIGSCVMSNPESSNVVPFKRPSAAQKHKGKSLCRSGFHKWVIVTEKQFDVKQGRLVTVYKCSRCGEQKVKAL